MIDIKKTALASILVATALASVGCQSLDRLKSMGKEPKNEPAKLVKINNAIQVLQPVFSTSLPDKNQSKVKVNKKDTPDLQVGVLGDVWVAGSRSGVVSAYQSGKLIWSVSVDAPIMSGVGISEQGLAVVGTRTGQVVAINVSTGQVVWQQTLPSVVLSPALLTDNRVLVSTNNGVLYGLDLATGQSVWQFSTQNPEINVRGTAKPLLLDGQTALFGTADGRIHAINPNTGTPLWTRRVGFATGASQVQRMGDVDGMPLVVGRYLYVPSFSGQLTGFDMSTGQSMFTADFPSTKDVVMQGGVLYATSVTGDVAGFNAMTGEKVWQNDELKYRKLTNPVAIGDYVAVGDLDGVIHLFDNTGKIVSRSQTKGQLTSLQVVDNRLYTQSSDNVISVWQAQ